MFPADLVADHPHFFQCPGRKVELSSGVRLDGVDDEVGVQVIRIKVCCRQNFTARKELLRQFQCDLMGLCRGNLFLRRKRLDVLVEEGVMCLAVQILGSHEALVGEIRHAVDTGKVSAPVRVHCLFFL